MQMIFATQRRTGKHRHFRRMHDKKVNVLALAAVLGAPDAVLPREVAAGLPQLMAGLLRLLVALKQQQVSYSKASVVCLKRFCVRSSRAFRSLWLACCAAGRLETAAGELQQNVNGL